MRFIFAILAAICLASPATAGLRVVASIVPVHSMVAAVMLGRGEPDLLLQGTLSEHTSGLSPAQLVQVGQLISVHGRSAPGDKIGRAQRQRYGGGQNLHHAGGCARRVSPPLAQRRRLGGQ